MTVFPNGKHDDQVDPTAQFLDWLKTPMPCWGFFEHTRRQAEKLKPPKPVYVRLKAPPAIGVVQTLSNRHITIAEDRIVVDVSRGCQLLNARRLDLTHRMMVRWKRPT